MIRYLAIFLLALHQALGATQCAHQWFKCLNGRSQLNCNKNKNNGWIRISQLCNGVIDCSDGSDEFLINCKMHPSMQLPHNFYCASGGVITEDQYCNNEPDCWDESDEYFCNDLSQDHIIQGRCKSTEMECLPGECIPLERLCNNKIDCTNGLDESLKMCQSECDDNEEFQCGNGQCIGRHQLCDNKADCLDGADELFNVCEDIEGYKPTPYRNCTESLGALNPKFDNKAKYHIANFKKFVWPNEPMSFKCVHTASLVGAAWNVCQLDGTWRFPLPQCKSIY